jgi:hypothetical protein
MSDNPYSPPSARVADFDPPGSIERPVIVIRAVYLLWASFALTIVAILYEGLQPDPDVNQGLALAITLVAIGVGTAIAVWLNTAAWRGRGYARWVMAVLTVIGFGFIFWMERAMPEIPPSAWYIQVIDVISWITSILGNAMLFAPGANAWYRQMRARR